MVRSIRCLSTPIPHGARRVVGEMSLCMLCLLIAATSLSAQQPSVHYWHHGVMPPGAIGSRQLQRGGPLPGYFQPVEIKAPEGVTVSLVAGNEFGQPQQCPRKAGFLIGAVYRMRVTNIRMAEGAEVFPTIEVIDRLYTPVGQERRFAIPVELTEEDLKLAIDGKFVTRVIYLEDPQNALPEREDPKSQNWYEAQPGQDPLAVADGLGRPVAILRMGGRLPDANDDTAFYFGSPPFADYPPEQAPAVSVASASPQGVKPAPTTERTPSTTYPSIASATPHMPPAAPQYQQSVRQWPSDAPQFSPAAAPVRSAAVAQLPSTTATQLPSTTVAQLPSAAEKPQIAKTPGATETVQKPKTADKPESVEPPAAAAPKVRILPPPPSLAPGGQTLSLFSEGAPAQPAAK